MNIILDEDRRYNPQDEEWVIYRVSKSKPSIINNGVYWRIGAYRINDNQFYDATIDSTCINFPTWEPIVNNQGPLGVYKGLFAVDRVNKAGAPVVSADSNPVLEYECSETPKLIKKLQEQFNNPQANLYASLFGDGD